ncbi:hypothetical protein DO021_20305 [Desulfobacter hydrogenophilus]|uniref:Uncharacterized protein n=1 Tax=Desulfobacter hydrogenophilus TaxID=2291 RepID=A0A328F9V8_9BACT|nr:hypothetical protein DO021_20305 [Desulfobacter hydrogenophilus]
MAPKCCGAILKSFKLNNLDFFNLISFLIKFQQMQSVLIGLHILCFHKKICSAKINFINKTFFTL